MERAAAARLEALAVNIRKQCILRLDHPRTRVQLDSHGLSCPMAYKRSLVHATDYNVGCLNAMKRARHGRQSVMTNRLAGQSSVTRRGCWSPGGRLQSGHGGAVISSCSIAIYRYCILAVHVPRSTTDSGRQERLPWTAVGEKISRISCCTTSTQRTHAGMAIYSSNKAARYTNGSLMLRLLA